MYRRRRPAKTCEWYRETGTYVVRNGEFTLEPAENILEHPTLVFIRHLHPLGSIFVTVADDDCAGRRVITITFPDPAYACEIAPEGIRSCRWPETATTYSWGGPSSREWHRLRGIEGRSCVSLRLPLELGIAAQVQIAPI